MDLLKDDLRRIRQLSGLALFGTREKPVLYTNQFGEPLYMDHFVGLMQRNRGTFDRLTLEACEDMRKNGQIVPEWLLAAEKDAWLRQQRRAANGQN